MLVNHHNNLSSLAARCKRSSAMLAGLSAASLALLPAAAFSSPSSTALVQASRQYAAAAKSSPKSRVIVTFTGDLSSADRARLSNLGCDIYRNLGFIHSAAMSLPKSNLAKLSTLSFVKNVTPDATVEKTDEFTMDGSQASVAYAANNSLTGKGVTVAVLDSGMVSSNLELSAPSTTTTTYAAVMSSSTSSTSNAKNSTLGGKPAPAPVPTPPGVAPIIAGPSGPGASGAPAGTPSASPTTTSTPGTRVLASVSMISGLDASDQCGHGTHVAGIIGGNAYYSTGPYFTQTFLGIARGVSFVNVRVLDGTGSGVASNVISGLSWCISNKSKYNIRVINLSLGMPVTQSYTTDPLCMAVEAAWKSGIVVVCAAGNNGRLSQTISASANNSGYGTNYGSIESPGNDPYVITVGATKRPDGWRADDTIASYSSRGPTLADYIAKPDIVAPGNKIISVLAQGSYLYNQYGSTNGVPFSAYTYVPTSYTSWNYFTLSGTSMAAPVVSGAAALMLQVSPSLSPDTVKARLMMTADAMTLADGTSDICSYGAGYLDIPSALKSNVVATSPAMSPTLYVDANGNVKFTANASLYGAQAYQNSDGTWSASTSATIWGTGQASLAAIYGGAALNSPSLVSTNRALWGDTSLSDSSSITSSRALWGDSGLAASRALWGDSTPAVDLSSVAMNGD